MLVGDHQLDTAQAAVGEVGEELTPERLILGVTDVEPEHFAVPVGAKTGSDHNRLRRDVAVLANMHVGGVEPDVDER